MKIKPKYYENYKKIISDLKKTETIRSSPFASLQLSVVAFLCDEQHIKYFSTCWSL